MNKIEKMIQELCPEGVEYKKLGEIGDVCMCKRIMKNETSPVGEIPFFKIGTFGKTPDAFITRELYEDYKKRFSFPKKGDILISASGTIGRTVVYDGEDAYFQDSNIVWIANDETIVTNEYLYFLYQTIDWTTEGGTIKRLYNNNLKATVVPIPPLPIQQEIVKALDAFTNYLAELQAELEARKEQYEYYRNNLLTFNKLTGGGITDNVRWIKLEDLFYLKNGYTPSKSNESFWTNGTVPWFRMEDIRENGRILYDATQKITPEAVKGGKYFKANTFIVATSATIGEHALIKTDYMANQRFTNLEVKEKFADLVNTQYLFHYLFILSEWCKNNTNISGFASVDMAKFKKFEVPIPSLSEQSRIVKILDQFETLVNDLTSGLPAEIAAVQEQYEYYRNQLLTFPAKG